MAVVHEEFGPVLLGGDGVRLLGRDTVKDFEVRDLDLKAARGALLCADLSRDAHGGLLGQGPDALENFRRNSALDHYSLDDAGAVAELREEEFAALAPVVKPALNLDFLAGVLADIPYIRER